jgi:hypothetical protein
MDAATAQVHGHQGVVFVIVFKVQHAQAHGGQAGAGRAVCASRPIGHLSGAGWQLI